MYPLQQDIKKSILPQSRIREIDDKEILLPASLKDARKLSLNDLEDLARRCMVPEKEITEAKDERYPIKKKESLYDLALTWCERSKDESYPEVRQAIEESLQQPLEPEAEILEPEAEELFEESGAELARIKSDPREDIQRMLENLKQEKESILKNKSLYLERYNPEELETFLEDIEYKIRTVEKEISQIKLPDRLKIGSSIDDSDPLSYYNTKNFSVYNLSIDNITGKGKNEILNLVDIRPNDPSKFCDSFPHLSEKLLSPPQQNFLDRATEEQLRDYHKIKLGRTSEQNTVFEMLKGVSSIPRLKMIAKDLEIPDSKINSIDAFFDTELELKVGMLKNFILESSQLTKIELIKRDLRDHFHRNEIEQMINKTWGRMQFHTSHYLAFISMKYFFTNLQNDLNLTPDNKFCYIVLQYTHSQYSYYPNNFFKDIEYDDVLVRLFNVEPGKRVIVEVFLRIGGRDDHSCLLISQNFDGLRKIIFYNPNSGTDYIYRNIKTFIVNKYNEFVRGSIIRGNIWNEDSIPYIWKDSNEISSAKYSIQRGPTCSLFSRKLWLLLVLNPNIDVEVLIDYSFNQSNNIVKQHILTFYSILYFIELFLEKITTLTDILKKYSEKDLLIEFHKIFESYFIISNYLKMNGCYPFKISDSLINKIADMAPKNKDSLKIYKYDPNFRILHATKWKEEVKTKNLVPSEFALSDIPDTPANASKKRKSKKSRKPKKKKDKSKKKHRKESKKRTKKESKETPKKHTKKNRKKQSKSN